MEPCAETGELPVLSTHHGDATVSAATLSVHRTLFRPTGLVKAAAGDQNR
jgi:hypothetical protein